MPCEHLEFSDPLSVCANNLLAKLIYKVGCETMSENTVYDYQHNYLLESTGYKVVRVALVRKTYNVVTHEGGC